MAAALAMPAIDLFSFFFLRKNLKRLVPVVVLDVSRLDLDNVGTLDDWDPDPIVYLEPPVAMVTESSPVWTEPSSAEEAPVRDVLAVPAEDIPAPC